jgi:hypothetical protein
MSGLLGVNEDTAGLKIEKWNLLLGSLHFKSLDLYLKKDLGKGGDPPIVI